MQAQMSVITLGVAALAPSRRFYAGGFGWPPVFENDEIVFYQMNGFVLGTWLKAALAADQGRPRLATPDPDTSPGFSLAHNVPTPEAVVPAMDRLLQHGGRLLRAAEAPPHGGRRGYVADPDGHAWEIAWNPAWPIDAEGRVRFAL